MTSQPDQASELGPGRHPPADGRYSYAVEDRIVHADVEHAGDMLAGGVRSWDDPRVTDILRPALTNPSISEAARALLPWALTTISSHSPGALGLVGRASYSGKGATSLAGNLAHSQRGEAFAAELICGACLVYRAWPATNDGTMLLGDAGATGARLDFGVKLVGSGTARRTAEADILLSEVDGTRRAIDVKFARSGSYRAKPSREMLEIVTQALKRGEIASFHFLTSGRFRPAVRAATTGEGICLHENVWPDEHAVRSIGLYERAAIDYAKAIRSTTNRDALDLDKLLVILSDAAAVGYQGATGGDRELLEMTPGVFTYLFDATPAELPSDVWPRLVAGWGRRRGATPAPPRDKSFMRGFPLPWAPFPLDRGHLIPRSAGGDEGIGINLVPQAASLNRGRSPEGRRWRGLENLLATAADAAVFVRALYDDPSDIPARLEYLVATGDGLVQLERFANRSGVP